MNKISIQSVLKKIPPRRADSHKKTYGHLLILAGSPGMTGAAALATEAAMRSGCGYVTLGIPESLNPIMEVKLTEVMTLALPETEQASISCDGADQIIRLSYDTTAVAIGPGISRNPETLSLVRLIVDKVNKPIVLDADAICAFSDRQELLSNKQVILTPHPGEFERLASLDKKTIVKKPEKTASRFAKKYGVVVVLKGHRTVVTDGRSVYVNRTGNPGMSTAGSGDVLTGMIASLLAQGAFPLDAAAMGVYLHGCAGDICRKRDGMMGMIAGDILAALPKVLKEFERIKK